MLIRKKRGKGFTDTLKNIGSYVVQNRDLIAKPLLGAAGDLTAFALAEGGKAVLTRLMKKKDFPQLDSKSTEILQTLMTGSGIKKF